MSLNFFKTNIMKSTILFTSLFFTILFSNSAIAQKSSKSEDIKVWGNCGMCKKTIEGAAIKAGATKAEWSEESKILSVSYKQNKTDTKKIQDAVAASGYDTQDVTAPAEMYSKLHSCCQYERKEVAKTTANKVCCDKENCDHKADCCKGDASCKEKGCCKN